SIKLDCEPMSQTLDALQSVDWDFTNTRTTHGIHSIHSYPAKFIAQIPRRLIELFYSGDASIVFDPFCGSGTTLVEACEAGIDAVGVDLNPIACLIASVKTTPLPCELGSLISDIVAEAEALLR